MVDRRVYAFTVLGFITTWLNITAFSLHCSPINLCFRSQRVLLGVRLLCFAGYIWSVRPSAFSRRWGGCRFASHRVFFFSFACVFRKRVMWMQHSCWCCLLACWMVSDFRTFAVLCRGFSQVLFQNTVVIEHEWANSSFNHGRCWTDWLFAGASDRQGRRVWSD